MGNKAAWLSMVGLLAAGCGFAPKASSPPASTTPSAAPSPSGKTPSPTISPSPAAANTSSCYPAWERHDLVETASAHLPVPTATVWSYLDGPRLDATNLAVWLGKPSQTALTPQSLLRGWSMPSSSRATGPLGVLTLMPHGNGPLGFGSTGKDLVLAEHAPTADQAARLQRLGYFSQSGAGLKSPFSLLIPIPSSAHVTNVKQAMQTVIDAVRQQGFSAAVSLLSPPPNPSSYRSYAGLILDIPGLRRPQNVCAPHETGWVMGVNHGLILPQGAPFTLDANGIRLGFASQTVILDYNHSGYDVVRWFNVPAIRVPTPTS